MYMENIRSMFSLTSVVDYVKQEQKESDVPYTGQMFISKDIYRIIAG